MTTTEGCYSRSGTEGYTTDGSVRGCCGHLHRTIRAAAVCLREDMDGCVKQGGYSDRGVVARDGRALSDDEQQFADDVVNDEVE